MSEIETLFYRCGECGRRFDSEAEVIEHASKPDVDGETHDGISWSRCGDEIAIVARKAFEDDEYGQSRVPWVFYGRWSFTGSGPLSDAGLGNTIRDLFQRGFVDVRVLHLRDAEYMFESTKDLREEVP